jgi:hypothetical protein
VLAGRQLNDRKKEAGKENDAQKYDARCEGKNRFAKNKVEHIVHLEKRVCANSHTLYL